MVLVWFSFVFLSVCLGFLVFLIFLNVLKIVFSPFPAIGFP